MYATIWRALPGPVWVRVITVVAIILAVLVACTFWIFPFVQEIIPQQVVTVDGQ